jgi:hypothetical protein
MMSWVNGRAQRNVEMQKLTTEILSSAQNDERENQNDNSQLTTSDRQLTTSN